MNLQSTANISEEIAQQGLSLLDEQQSTPEALPGLMSYHSICWLAPLLIMFWPWGGYQGSMPDYCQGASGMLLLYLFSVAVVTDIHRRKIRNWLCYPVACYALLLNTLQSVTCYLYDINYQQLLGGIGLGDSLLGLILCFSGAFTLFLIFQGGAGDVKFMAVLGALLGWFDAFQVWTFAMLTGGLLMIVIAIYQAGITSFLSWSANWLGTQGLWLKYLTNNASVEGTNKLLKQRIPLAPLFACGLVFVLWQFKNYPEHHVFSLMSMFLSGNF